MSNVSKPPSIEHEGPFPGEIYEWCIDLRRARAAVKGLVLAIEQELYGDPLDENRRSNAGLFVVKDAVLDDMRSAMVDLDEFASEGYCLIDALKEQRSPFRDLLFEAKAVLP